ncbi:MAG: tetratricopeptide repeat-containing glycosyltransferase family protein [Gammaproteobacteria bacterium]|nr:tetratricopeptide repeat-containing glycosyltransferase family protein [Gammaproteobacteria bacterium]
MTKAIALYEEVLQLDDKNPDANHLLGLALLGGRKQENRQKVLEYLERAVAIRPDLAVYHNDLGNAYWNQGRVADAWSEFQLAASLDTEFVQAYFNLGNACWIQDRFEDAVVAFRHAIELDDDWTQAHYQLANCLQYTGRLEEAIDAYGEALKRNPDYADAHIGRGSALLKLGRLAEGWDDYEFRQSDASFELFRCSGRARWDGSDFCGKTLLVYGEQGIGDVIHFSRYLPMVAERGGQIVFMCDASLHSLFERNTAVHRLVDKCKTPEAIERIHYDVQIPLLSLPRVFGTTLESIPRVTPYLRADSSKVDAWRGQLEKERITVGLVWAGNPGQKDNKYRSCPLSALAPLAAVDGSAFYSIQVGPAAEQLQGGPKQLKIIDFTEELRDFGDTAALIEALDLVITVDTATAHLAGALGKPVWTMLWFAHCWRYLQNRTDSPWYPSMRLFRQPRHGDWDSVVGQIANALKAEISGCPKARAP